MSGFSVFHNNVVSLYHNLFYEVDFNFNVIGVTETKITNANSQMCTTYMFQHLWRLGDGNVH